MGGLIRLRFSVRGDEREAVVVVIDEKANIVGFYQGNEHVEDVLRLLEIG